MNSNAEFFNAEYNSNRDKWLRADAGDDAAWNTAWNNNFKYGWGTGNSWEADKQAWNDEKQWRGADGTDAAGNAIQAHGSAPFILQIVNACTSAIANVDIGDSYTNSISSNAALNFGQSFDITTTSTVSGVTYLEFLRQSESKPFTVGKTMIISTSAGQLDQTVAITHRNASGDRNDHVITPTLDPFQNQTDRVIDNYEYLFDGMTRLRFNQINGSATVTLRIYPKNLFSATQIIAGRPAEQVYAAPNFVSPLLAAGQLF